MAATADFDPSRLAERLVETEKLAPQRATRLAEEIAGAGDDIRAVAEHWLRTDAMPSEPVIADYSPQDLAEFLPPSEVLTSLVGLRYDRENTLSMLQHPGDLNYVADGIADPEPHEEPALTPPPASEHVAAEDVSGAAVGGRSRVGRNVVINEERRPAGHAVGNWPPFALRSMLDVLLDIAPTEPEVYALDWEPYPSPPALAGRQPDVLAKVGDALVVVAKLRREPALGLETVDELRYFEELGRQQGAPVQVLYFVPQYIVGDIEQLLAREARGLSEHVHILAYNVDAQRLGRPVFGDLFQSYLSASQRHRRLFGLFRRRAT